MVDVYRFDISCTTLLSMRVKLHKWLRPLDVHYNVRSDNISLPASVTAVAIIIYRHLSSAYAVAIMSRPRGTRRSIWLAAS